MSYIGNKPSVQEITIKGYPDFASADATPKQAGRLVYVIDENIFYKDNGTDLLDVDGQSLGTGIVSGGTLSYTGPGDDINISEGRGKVLDASSPDRPVSIEVTWPNSVLTINNVATDSATYVGVDDQGNFFQKNTAFTEQDLRTYVYLGLVNHRAAVITTVEPIVNPLNFPANNIQDLAKAIGNLTISGNIVSGGNGDLSINKSTGVIFKYGANFHINVLEPSLLNVPQLISPSVIEYYDDGAGGLAALPESNQLDPTVFDNGSGTPAAVTNGWSVKRVFLAPTQNRLVLSLGRVRYGNVNQAIQRYLSESQLTPPGIEELSLLGYIVVRGNATDLDGTNNVRFIQSGKFGSVSNSSALQIKPEIISTAVDATAEYNSTVIVEGAVGPVTITLPTAASEGQLIGVKVITSDIIANPVTIQADGLEFIDNANTYLMESETESVRLTADGTKWVIA